MKKKFIILFVFLNTGILFSVFSQINRYREIYNSEKYEIENLFFNVMDINWDKGLLAYRQVYQMAERNPPNGGDETLQPCDCNYENWEEYPKIGIIYGVYDLNKGKVLKDFYILKSVFDKKNCTTTDELNKNADDYLAYCKSEGLNVVWGQYEQFTEMHRYFDENYGQLGDIHFKANYINDTYNDENYTIGNLYADSEPVFTVNQKESWIMGSRGKMLFERIYSKDDKYFLFYEYFWISGTDAPNMTVFDFTPILKKNKNLIKNKEIVNLFKTLPPEYTDGDINYLFDDENSEITTDSYYLHAVDDNVNYLNEYALYRLFFDKNLYLFYVNFYDFEYQTASEYSQVRVLDYSNKKWTDVTNKYLKNLTTRVNKVNGIYFNPVFGTGKVFDVNNTKKIKEIFVWKGDEFLIRKAEDFLITNDKVGKIGKGMTIEQVRQLFPELDYESETDVDSEGTNYYFEKYNDFIYVFQPKDSKILTYTEIFSPAFYTEKGISTLSTYKDLRKAYPDLTVEQEEGYYELVYNARTEELPNVTFCFGPVDNLTDDKELEKITIYFGE